MSETDMRMNLPLLALALGAFGIGTTEFSPMGLLPEIATSLNVSIPEVGLLVSIYAIGVMLGAPIMTLLLSRTTQRLALVSLLILFTVGNALTAVAPNFGTVAATRLLTSLSHGAFFGIGSVLAVSLVPKERQSQALATVFTGLTVANIGGVPAATWLGQHVGWRTTFACIAVFGAIAAVALWWALPRGETCGAPDLRRELRVVTRPPVLLSLAVTVAGAAAMFTTYTYVSPIVREITGAGSGFLTSSLMVVGIGFSIGNAVAGRLADRSINATLLGFLLLVAAISGAMPLLLNTRVGVLIGFLVWGFAVFGVVPPVQMMVMRRAVDAPGLASSLNIGAFNVGNAVGAFIGGAVLWSGLGYAFIPPAGALMALGGVGLLLLARRSPRQVSGTPVTESVAHDRPDTTADELTS